MKFKLTILVLLISLGTFAQSGFGLDYTMSRGLFSETYKQVGVSYKLGKTYSVRGSFGLDNLRTPKENGVRQRYDAGFGARVTKELELVALASVAIDRQNGVNHAAEKYGATLGGNYHFSFLGFAPYVGVTWNTIPLTGSLTRQVTPVLTREVVVSKPSLPQFTVGFDF